MLKVNEHTVRSIVKRLLEEANAAASGPSKIDLQYHEGVFSTVNEAVQSATRALPLLREMKIANREALIRDLRAAVIRERDDLAVRIHNETGLGRIEDKIAKITLAAEKTPGTEDLAVRAVSGDSGLSLIEHAPYGVIASILPVTNPAETIINNAISMTAGGNAVVFNPHPSAQKVSAHVIGILNAEGKKHTGCPNIFSCISETSLDSARELMRHPLTDLLVVTGGPAVVKEALQSGKRVIAAGPGNPPVLVDESADAVQAARDIVFGASFDNNIICCEEKEIFVHQNIYDQFLRSLKQLPVIILAEHQTDKLMKRVFTDGHPDKRFIGKNASVLLAEIGVQAGDEIRLIISEVDEDHPLVHTEQLMPFLPLVKVRSTEAGIAQAYQAENGRFHSAYMHSQNISHLHAMARKMNTAIFVKNAPSLAGLGYETDMYTSFTIAGCTGEGLTTARTFTRERLCVLKGYFHIV